MRNRDAAHCSGEFAANAVMLDHCRKHPPLRRDGPVAVVAAKNISTVAKQIQLDGSGSTSSDGKPLSYSWQVVAGTPSASITSGNTANPSVQFDSGFGAYIFQ